MIIYSKIYEGLRIDKGQVDATIRLTSNSLIINGESFPLIKFLKLLALNLGYDLSDIKQYRDNYDFNNKILVIRANGEIMFSLWSRRFYRSFCPSFRLKKPLQRQLFRAACKKLGYTIK